MFSGARKSRKAKKKQLEQDAQSLIDSDDNSLVEVDSLVERDDTVESLDPEEAFQKQFTEMAKATDPAEHARQYIELATTGNLTGEQKKQLDEHLADDPERERLMLLAAEKNFVNADDFAERVKIARYFANSHPVSPNLINREYHSHIIFRNNMEDCMAFPDKLEMINQVINRPQSILTPVEKGKIDPNDPRLARYNALPVPLKQLLITMQKSAADRKIRNRQNAIRTNYKAWKRFLDSGDEATRRPLGNKIKKFKKEQVDKQPEANFNTYMMDEIGKFMPAQITSLKQDIGIVTPVVGNDPRMPVEKIHEMDEARKTLPKQVFPKNQNNRYPDLLDH